MNFLLAIFIFTIYLSKAGYALPEVSNITDKSPAYEAGLQVGDKFLKADESRILSADDIRVAINMAKNNPVNFLIERNGEKKEISITPELVKENEIESYRIGFSFVVKENPTMFESFKQSFNKTATAVVQTFKGLKMLVTGEANLKTDVGGPVTIIRMTGVAAQNGIWNLMHFIAFISVNLAVFNMLPIPALDGGWTIILLIELITKRKVPDRIVGTINYIGMIALFGLMILVTIKDILFPIKF